MSKEIADHLNKKVSGCNATFEEREIGDSPVFVDGSKILDVCRELKSGPYAKNVLQVITGCDYEDRIEVSYILASFSLNTELILKVKLAKENAEAVPTIDSVESVWRAADFQERECYDMLGVRFNNHPDLRRILCPDDWEGYPLRQDYKVQEKYLNMKVNPEHKMNREDHHYFKKVQEEMGENAKKVTFSWKGE